jgi:hypothetical protein
MYILNWETPFLLHESIVIAGESIDSPGMHKNPIFNSSIDSWVGQSIDEA